MGRHHQSDFYGWTLDQADALRRRSVNEIDWDNLLEEIQALGRSERRELRSRLAVIVQHLLKWRVQVDRRSRSWSATITEQRAQVRDILDENPSLIAELDETLAKAYRAGLNAAVGETGLPPEVLGAVGQMSFEAVMAAPLERGEES